MLLLTLPESLLQSNLLTAKGKPEMFSWKKNSVPALRHKNVTDFYNIEKNLTSKNVFLTIAFSIGLKRVCWNVYL